ncbi:MAG TPA: hypothetical protein VGB73_15685 [Pyrinomonadaceae bacterium]
MLNPGQTIKRIAVLVAACFLAFAPPGTLIFGALAVVMLFGKTGLIVVAVSLVFLLALVRLLYKSSEEKPH